MWARGNRQRRPSRWPPSKAPFIGKWRTSSKNCKRRPMPSGRRPYGQTSHPFRGGACSSGADQVFDRGPVLERLLPLHCSPCGCVALSRRTEVGIPHPSSYAPTERGRAGSPALQVASTRAVRSSIQNQLSARYGAPFLQCANKRPQVLPEDTLLSFFLPLILECGPVTKRGALAQRPYNPQIDHLNCPDLQ